MGDILDDDFGDKEQNIKGLELFSKSSMLQVVGVFVAGFLAIVDVESILFTGAVICLFSLLNWFIPFKEGKWFGIYPWLFSALCAGLITAFSLSPREAQLPIPILIFIFAFFLLKKRKTLLENR